MKTIKNIFYGLMIIIMLLCAGILIIALSPKMTKSVSQLLYGEAGPEAFGNGSNTNQDASDGNVMTAPNSQGIPSGVLASEESAGYVAPLRAEVKLPNQVSSLNGYEPVSSSAEELGDEQADNITSYLGPGETGDDYSFDAEFYPYYHMLNGRMQHVYRQIYANANVGNTSFAPIEKVNTDQLKYVFEAVINDHPELFWLDTRYSCKYRTGGECVEMKLEYNRTASNLAQSKEKFEAESKKILDAASKFETDLEKEREVHNALIEKADYVASSGMNQSAYSALVTGDTVCAGYARAFQYLMQKLGIPCYYCTGYSGEDHAWNIVKLDNGYSNVDVTWDDTKPATEDYFNKSDAELVGTHVRTSLSVYLPPCGSNTGDGNSESTGAQQGNVVAGITLNPNPSQPLIWEKDDEKGPRPGTFVSGNDLYDMDEAGIVEGMAQMSLKDYYANCRNQMVNRGSGQQSFSNVVPKYVLAQVERSYGTGDYEKGYVKSALTQLEMDHFAIQIQVVPLGGNFYRLYHNVNTWKDEP